MRAKNKYMLMIGGYEVDPADSRVYHYTPLRTRDECLKEKTESLVVLCMGHYTVSDMGQSISISMPEISPGGFGGYV